MKGIARKFGHEKTKILQIAGTIEKTHDNDFEAARETLEKLIKGITGLLKNAEKEDENIQEIMDPLKTLASDVDQFLGAQSSSQGSIDSALIQTDSAITTYLNQQKLMYVHLNAALAGLNGVKRKVAKRDDRLLDYDKYRTKLHHAKEQQEKKLIEKYERKFGAFSQEYLQLNQELKVQIEAEYSKLATYINTQMHLMYQRQRIMYSTMNVAFHEVADADIVSETAQAPAHPTQPKSRPRSVTAPNEESSGVGGFLNNIRRSTLRGSGNKPPPPTQPAPATTPAPAVDLLTGSNTLVPPIDTRQRSASIESAQVSNPPLVRTPTPAPTPSTTSNTSQPAPMRRPPSTTLPVPPGRRPPSTTLPSRPTAPFVPLPSPPVTQTQPVPAIQVPSRPLPAPAPSNVRNSLPPTPAHNLPPTPSPAQPAPVPTPVAPQPVQQPAPVTPQPTSPVQPSQPTLAPAQPTSPPAALEPVQTTSSEDFLQLDELGYDYTATRPKSVMMKQAPQKPPHPNNNTAAKPTPRQESFGAFGTDDFSTSSWGTGNTQNMFGNEGQFS